MSQGAGILGVVEASVLVFCEVARELAAEARRLGLAVPGFRSPPRLAGVDRTIRRARDGGVVVAIRRRGRACEATVDDMVDGIVVANGLAGVAADTARGALRAAARSLEPPPYPNR